ncbi:MAG: CHAT domain-containing tetratricopeptide repeat protein, partial [Bacteroidota bacterium]
MLSDSLRLQQAHLLFENAQFDSAIVLFRSFIVDTSFSDTNVEPVLLATALAGLCKSQIANDDVPAARHCWQAYWPWLDRHLPKRHPIRFDLMDLEARLLETREAYPSALQRYKDVFRQRLDVFGESHPETAKSHLSIGRLQLHSRTLDTRSAREHLEEALRIREAHLPPDDLRIAEVYQELRYYYVTQAEVANALDCVRKVLDIYQAHFGNFDPRSEDVGKSHPGMIKAYESAGQTYAWLGLREVSLRYQQQALDSKLARYGKMDRRVARSYDLLGALYALQNDLELSVENYREAIAIQSALDSVPTPQLSDYHDHIAEVLRNQEKYEEAMYHYETGLAMRKAIYPEVHPHVSDSYDGMAIYYLRRNDEARALAYHQKALRIKKQFYESAHLNTGYSYYMIGNVWMQKGDGQRALDNYYQTLRTFAEANTVDSDHPLLYMLIYKNIAQAWLSLNEYELALQNIQKTLQLMVLDFAPSDLRDNPAVGSTVRDKVEYLDVLRMKGETFFGRYRAQGDRKDLELAQQNYDMATFLIDDIRRSYSRKADKRVLQKTTAAIYEAGIRVARTMYDLSGDVSYLNKAWEYMERNKSMLLLESISDQAARQLSNIPDSLLQYEAQLQRQKAEVEGLLLFRRNAGTPVSALDAQYHRLYELRQQHDALAAEIELAYPAYHQLKTNIGVADLQALQTLLPDEQTAVLQYFVGQHSLFVLVATKQEQHLVELQKDFPLQEWIGQLRRQLQEAQIGRTLGNKESAAQFVQLSHQLYNRLMAPIADLLPEQLIIVPDGELGYLPFEMLVVQAEAEPVLFGSHRFVLHDHSISYTYSATILREMMDRGHDPSQLRNFIAFAPSFVEQPAATKTNMPMRDADALLSDLRYNVPEVRSLHQMLGGKMLIGAQATRSAFTQQAPQYRIVHLATHGKANDRIGDFSYLAFAKAEEAKQYERLYNRDLYHLQLNADMVVLSACETGIGELQKGEGMISMARGFSYAGAASIITTLWNVTYRDETRPVKRVCLVAVAFYKIQFGLPKCIVLSFSCFDVSVKRFHQLLGFQIIDIP